jgi:hypothetical protein
MNTVKIIENYNLSADQADEVGNKAAKVVADFLNEVGIDFEIYEDGVTILDGEDEIIEKTGGNWDSIADLTKEADERYFSAFVQEAQMIS